VRIRAALLIATTLAVATVTVGLAAGLPIQTRTLGAGSAPVAPCDLDGITVRPVLSASNVSSISIGGIAAQCAGASLSATLTNGTSTASGTTTVPAGGGSASVALAALPLFTESMTIDVVMSGP
jgi:expansin (peptidoglycan-binding protein)